MSRPLDPASVAVQVRSADRWISRIAAATVTGLAGVAGALSYSHMRELAEDHGQAGWHAHAFPLSVDGIEIVASLVLLADRRAGRRSGWLPWGALVAGTAGILAANIATAHPDPVSRITAGWPAVALLIAIKLLSGILEHHTASSDPAAAIPFPPRKRQPARPHDATLPTLADTTGGTRQADAPQPAPDMTPLVAALLPAARQATNQLKQDGQPLTRDSLAARLRHHGHPVRNATLTPLLRHLRQEQQHPAT